MTSPWAAEPFIYFAIEDGADPAVKIGIALDPRDRIRQLATGTPRGLHLLGVFRGTLAKERRFQGFMRAHHIKGEWFRPHTEVLAAVRDRRQAVPAQVVAEVFKVDLARIEKYRRRKWLVAVGDGCDNAFHLSDVEIFARRLDQDGGARVNRLQVHYPLTAEQKRAIRGRRHLIYPAEDGHP